MPRRSRCRLNLSDEEKKARRREQKKMSMRRARAKLDAVALEERRKKDRERYQHKKENGLIKTIQDFTPRQQRQVRKMWREKSKLRREKEKIRKQTEIEILENTSHSSPSVTNSSFSRVASGRTVSAKNRRKLKLKNEYLSNRIQLLEKRLAKYRMRIVRLKKSKQKSNTNTFNIKQTIHNFLTDDENSRLTAGRKETITRRKVKKQIRLLNDSLLNLHKLFVNKTALQVSYETFRRYRPFWILFPKAASRNTCLCQKHANNDFIVHALHQAKILPYSSTNDAAKSLCCNNVLNVSCLERKCNQCIEKTPQLSIKNANDTIMYQRWITKNVSVIVKGQEKQFKKTVKETVKTSQRSLAELFKSNLPIFMQHQANIINQYRAVTFIKQNLTPSDGLLHIDFSENYACKYGTEIQSAHFGGSKGQLSLHTCVYYSTDSQSSENITKATSICTVSEDLRHDPVLICAHLKPVVHHIKMLTPGLRNLHILSDGPSTQYRNKTMFHLIVNYLRTISDAETITWHFSESGHGKGAPDGVGGTVKRVCDKAVANGRDIIDITSAVNCLKENCKGIIVIPIEGEHVPEIQKIADAISIRPFKGTFKIHQVCWTATEPNILRVRRLSCVVCANHITCPHFHIGQIVVSNVEIPGSPSNSSLDSAIVSPVVPSPGTASASTITAPDTPQLPEPPVETPSPGPSFGLQRIPLTPRKRLNFFDIYSDSSNSLSPPKAIKRPFRYILSDSDDENFPPQNSSVITKPNRRGLVVPDDSDSDNSGSIGSDENIF